MTITINQILVICLILVLIAFVSVLAKMGIHAISLIKNIKELTKAGKNLVDEVQLKADRVEASALNAVNSIVSDTSPITKTIGVIAGGLMLWNFGSLLSRNIIRRGGTLAVIASNRERAKARKEIKRTKKTIRKVNKQAKLRKKAEHKLKKVEKKAKRQERREQRKSAKIVKSAKAA
ncbi:MAG: hypothetical protein GX083_00195 [Clostridiales bacterium]|nr:hypothetical protein [Clostridiales bacterium]